MRCVGVGLLAGCLGDGRGGVGAGSFCKVHNFGAQFGQGVVSEVAEMTVPGALPAHAQGASDVGTRHGGALQSEVWIRGAAQRPVTGPVGGHEGQATLCGEGSGSRILIPYYITC